jgi:hypothetical protein
MPRGVWKDRDPAKRSEAARKAAASRARRDVPARRPRGVGAQGEDVSARLREIADRVKSRAEGGWIDEGAVLPKPGEVAARIDVVLAAVERER